MNFIVVYKFNLLFQAVNAQVVRDVCTRYIYDKCPAVVGVGK